MKTLGLASLFVVVGAIGFSSAAFAQTTVGSQTIAEEDMSQVQEHCDALATDGQAAAGDAAEAAAPGVAAANEAAAGAAGAEPAAPADVAAPSTDGLDLEAITLEDCRAADLVE